MTAKILQFPDRSKRSRIFASFQTNIKDMLVFDDVLIVLLDNGEAWVVDKYGNKELLDFDAMP